MKLLLVREGVKRVLAACEGERCPLREFLEALRVDAPAEQAKLLRRLEALAQGEVSWNQQLSRKVGEDIWELKAQTGLARLFYFFDGAQIVVVSHGAKKPKKKLVSAEVARAAKARERYLRDKREGKNTVVEELS